MSDEMKILPGNVQQLTERKTCTLWEGLDIIEKRLRKLPLMDEPDWSSDPPTEPGDYHIIRYAEPTLARLWVDRFGKTKVTIMGVAFVFELDETEHWKWWPVRITTPVK